MDRKAFNTQLSQIADTMETAIHGLQKIKNNFANDQILLENRVRSTAKQAMQAMHKFSTESKSELGDSDFINNWIEKIVSAVKDEPKK